jgi:hypothetical protein
MLYLLNQAFLQGKLVGRFWLTAMVKANLAKIPGKQALVWQQKNYILVVQRLSLQAS